METLAERNSRIIAQRSNDLPPEEPEWCLALHGNHDEHQCHKKPGHEKWQEQRGGAFRDPQHECHCGVWW